MKRLLFATLLMLALTSTSAFADSFHLFFTPNLGSGDNFSYKSWSNTGSLFVSGDTPADFFGVGNGYAPGSSLGGSTDIIFEPPFLRIGRVSYELQLDPGTLFMSSITLPTNGKDFTAFVQISFSGSGIFVDTGESIGVGGSANGHIHFSFIDGAYLPDAAGFVQTPAPGSWALIGTGLTGILAAVRRLRPRVG